MRRVLAILFLVSLAFAAHGQGIISTIAGSTWTFPADGRPATAAPLGGIKGLALDAQGNLYVADPDNAMVMKVAPNGVLTVVAGNGIRGFSGDFGPAVNASLNCVEAIAVDSGGNIYIADQCEYRVRKVTPDGIISTVAGNGTYEVSGDGGRATDTALTIPGGVAVDSAGNLYISEWGIDTGTGVKGTRIRQVTPAGIITTVAGAGTRGLAGDGGPAVNALLFRPGPLAVDSQGNVLFIDGGDLERVRKFRPGGNISTVAEGINAGGLAVDTSGLLYIADRRGHRIKRVQSDGTTVTVAGSGPLGYSGDGGPALNATFAYPQGVALGPAGTIYVSDTLNGRLRRINQDKTIETIGGNGAFKYAGDGGSAAGAFLNQPNDVVVDSAGNIYIADTYNHRIRKISNGVITTYAGSGLPGFLGDGGPAAKAQLCYPLSLALDSKRNLYIADTQNHRIRVVNPAGVITTVVGGGSACGGNPGPDGPITLDSPVAVAVDSKDTLYGADGFRILRIDGNRATVLAGTGNFSTVPAADGVPANQATLEYPGGLAVDVDGTVYFGQRYSFSRIRKIDPRGILGTVTGLGRADVSGDGGPALQADVGPAALRFDASGALLIADQSYARIRRISGGIINSVAGGGSESIGDGRPALSAQLSSPGGMAGTADGSLYIADTGDDRIRLVSAAPSPFNISTQRLDFSSQSGGAVPPDQTIRIISPVAGLPFAATVLEGNWLAVRPASGVMPATLLVTANPASLNVGVFETRIAIAVPAANQVRIVNVSFDVKATDAPHLSTDTDYLGYAAVQSTSTVVRPLQVLNNGSGVLNFKAEATMTTGNGWLRLIDATGAVSAGSPRNVGVQLTPADLSPGTYSGLITVSSTQVAQPIFVPVKFTITAATQSIVLSQSGLAFQSLEGASNLAPQSFGILNSGAGVMNWTVSKPATLSGGDWLSVTPASGASGPGGSSVPPVQVRADPSRLPKGDYYGQVDIVAPGAVNSPQRIPVVLEVLAADTILRPEVKPTGLIFVSGTNQTDPSQVVTLTNYGGSPITFRSSQSSTDFQYRPQAGTITADQPVRIVVTSRVGLPTGIRRSTLTLEFSDGTNGLVEILVVTPPGVVAGVAGQTTTTRAVCAPGSLGMVFTLLGQAFNTVKSIPTPLQVRVVDNCGTFLSNGTVVGSFSNGDRQLALIPTGDGYWDGTWVPSAAGSSARVRIRVDAQDLDRTLGAFIEITGGVDPNSSTPVISRGSVVNSANPSSSSPIAPGMLITIFGERLASSSSVPDPGTVETDLAGTKVVLKGALLPLLYVGSNQINAIVPWDLQPNTSLQLFVQQGNTVAVPAEVLVSAVQPAIFTMSGAGSGQGAIVNVAGTVVGSASPAHTNDTVVIFASGLGAVTPAVSFAAPSPSNPLARTVAGVQVTIGGKVARVDFAGLAPGFFGLYQINAVVPDGVQPGDSVPVTITAGAETSPPVTIAVR